MWNTLNFQVFLKILYCTQTCFVSLTVFDHFDLLQSCFIFHLFILHDFASDKMTLDNEQKKVIYMHFLKEVPVWGKSHILIQF